MFQKLTGRAKWAGLVLPVVVVTAVAFFSLFNVVLGAAAASEPGDWLYNMQQPALQLQQRLNLNQSAAALPARVVAEELKTPADDDDPPAPIGTPTAQPTVAFAPTLTPQSTVIIEPTATAVIPSSSPTSAPVSDDIDNGDDNSDDNTDNVVGHDDSDDDNTGTDNGNGNTDDASGDDDAGNGAGNGNTDNDSGDADTGNDDDDSDDGTNSNGSGTSDDGDEDDDGDDDDDDD